MGIGRAMKKMMFSMLVGAALAYFFDPANGPERRRSLQRMMAKNPPTRSVGTVSDLTATSPRTAVG
jgi:hypothetical protein